MSNRSAASKSLVLAAMIFAVSMTFIDQTIVAIAAPQVQKELGLSSTGLQWAVNAYLLTLAALFPLGGRLSDILGHRRMVVLGIVVFAVASGLCGLTPKGSAAEAWIVTARALQGAGGAIMYPAALAIVVSTFSLGERGRALALFFGVAGGLTAVGPVLGGYLTQWTWRAIFWVNVPVALIALLLIAISRPDTEYRPARLDYRGLALVTAGIGLSVFGLQQANIWGWRSSATGCAVAAGVALLVAFWFVELRTESPLVSVRIFGNRPFLVENLVLFVSMLVFVPVFFFASEYAQISLGDSASKAGIFLLYFFIGFVVAAQVGGSLFDKGGAKRPVVQGCALSAVGFFLWANHVTDLKFDSAVVHHSRWRRYGDDAGPSQHRRRESRVAPVVRRSYRHHPNCPQLCRQPRPRRARDHPGPPLGIAHGHVPHSARTAQRASDEGRRSTRPRVTHERIR